MIVFEVLGCCLPKPRPRAAIKWLGSGWGRGKPVPYLVYPDSEDSRKWSRDIAEAAVAAFKGVVDPENPYRGPVELEIQYVIDRPKSLPKWKSMQTPMLDTPDLDNLDKLVLDSLTKVIWRDDRQVWKQTASKVYAAIGELPRCIIGVQFTEELKRAKASPPEG